MDSINDILSSRSSQDISSLKAMAESVFGSDSSAPEQNQSAQGFNLSPDMLLKLSSVMNAMNSAGGEKYRLIEALKPNLSEKRQKKANEAMQMMKILEILPMLGNLNSSGDNNGKR